MMNIEQQPGSVTDRATGTLARHRREGRVAQMKSPLSQGRTSTEEYLRIRIFELEHEIGALREMLNSKDRSIVSARRENEKLHREIEANYELMHQVRTDLKILEDIARIDPTSSRRLTLTLQHRLAKIRSHADILEVTRQTEDFIEKLQRLVPQLTDAELQIASFLRIGFSTTSIATTCSISERTVENHRLRLRRKLGLAPQESLCEYLEHLDDHTPDSRVK